MNDLGSIFLAVCGLGVVCFGAFALAIGLVFRVTGKLMLMPLAKTVFSTFLGERGGADDPTTVARPTPRNTSPGDIDARIQAANRQFDEAMARQQRFTQPGTALTAQASNSPETDMSQFDLDQPLPNDRMMSRWGVRKATSSPGRRLQDRRFKRNRGPTRMSEEVYKGLIDSDGNVRSTGRSSLGPPETPRRRRRDSNDDEIFGGMLDESGDGFPDF